MNAIVAIPAAAYRLAKSLSMSDPKDQPPQERVYAWWEIVLIMLCVAGGIAYGFALMRNGVPGG